MNNKIIKSFLNGYIAVVFLSFFVVLIKPVINPENETFIPLLFRQLLMFDLLFWLVIFIPNIFITSLEKACTNSRVWFVFYIVILFIVNMIAVLCFGIFFYNFSDIIVFKISPFIFSRYGFFCTVFIITILTRVILFPVFKTQAKENCTE